MRLILLSLVLACGLASPSSAQDSRWQAFPSLRNVQALAASSEALWAGTDGGVYRYAPATGEIEQFTPVDGLSGVDAEAVAFDAARGAVWVGYPNGALDRVDVASGAVRSFFEIAQADRFNSRGINRIDVVADSLLIATEFGVVVFDVARNEVSDTYERFGTLAGGTPVGDVQIAPLPDGQPGLWVGTRGGIAYAPLSAPNLREPSAWTVDVDTLTDVLSLAFFDGTLIAGTEQTRNSDTGEVKNGGAYRRQGDARWERFIGENESTSDLFPVGDDLAIVSQFRLLLLDAEETVRRFQVDGAFVLQAGTLGPNGRVWTGDFARGLIAYPDLDAAEPGTVVPERVLIPDGPTTNAILSLDIAPDGDVWAGFESPNDFVSGFGRFDGTTWENFSLDNGALPRRAPIFTIHVGDRRNVWFGSDGAGTYQYAEDGEVTLYNSANSTIQNSDSRNPNYFVTVGLDTDDDGNLWVSNRFTQPPLHVRTPDGTWTGLPRPPSVPTDISYDKIYIDSFGQKWITAHRSDGFFVLDTGADPLDASDDQAAVVRNVSTEVGFGLPNDEVNVVIEDRSGRMWLGTNRGLATVFSPGSIFVGDPAQQVTWARTPDGASFFLRDLRIFDIAVDPADRKWLASEAGVWLINAEGNEVIANFTTENAPLPSNTVVAVEVDDASGAVYFATSGGLYRYGGDAVAAAPAAEDLFIYPNPARADGGALPEIAITGLVDDADVRVLTVDGQVVASFRTRGGSVRWNGRDQRTGALVPSGVYIVAAAGQNGEGTAYGKIAVIR